MGAMVSAQGLVKTYRRSDGSEIQAVRGISLEIEQGEIFSLLGPNGAGKSTTIGMISGLIAPSQGDAVIGGFSINRQPLQAKQLIGVVPQEVALYMELNARQNLEFFGRMYGLGGAELKKRVDEVLDFIDLRDRQHDRVSTFSGGMKRRVNIGVGLLHRPRLIYMDEPTVGIDPQNRRRVLDTVLRLRQEYKMTVLYTTHLMEEAQELSDRVGIIDHGQIIALGTQGELVQQIGEEDRLIFSLGEQTPSHHTLEVIQAIQTVTQVQFEPSVHEAEGALREAKLIVFAKRGRKALAQIVTALDSEGVAVASVEVREPDLEAVFLQLTGRALRD